MNDLALLFNAVVSLMKTELSIYGLTFSFWDIFLWLMIVGAILLLIRWWLGD